MNIDMSKEKCIKMYDEKVERWVQSYDPNFKGYPGNQKRLKIILDIARRCDPRNALFIGCGPCVPMVKTIQNIGCAAWGIDFSAKMIERGKQILTENGCDPETITVGDIEQAQTLPEGEFDFATASGVFMHLEDEKVALENINRKLSIGATAALEFRNSLLSMFSFNSYSYDFFTNRLFEGIDFDPDLKLQLDKFLRSKFSLSAGQEYKPGFSEESDGIVRKFHNPLTINKLFEKFGFSLENNYFYHFHVVPSDFYTEDKEACDKLSLLSEDPLDWRGHFMASAFVSQVTKIADV